MSEKNMKKFITDFIKEVNEIDKFYTEKFNEYSKYFITMQTKYHNRNVSKKDQMDPDNVELDDSSLSLVKNGTRQSYLVQ